MLDDAIYFACQLRADIESWIAFVDEIRLVRPTCSAFLRGGIWIKYVELDNNVRDSFMPEVVGKCLAIRMVKMFGHTRSQRTGFADVEVPTLVTKEVDARFSGNQARLGRAIAP